MNMQIKCRFYWWLQHNNKYNLIKITPRFKIYVGTRIFFFFPTLAEEHCIAAEFFWGFFYPPTTALLRDVVAASGRTDALTPRCATELNFSRHY